MAGALDTLVRGGKVRYWGVSNDSGWHLMKTIAAADRLGRRLRRARRGPAEGQPRRRPGPPDAGPDRAAGRGRRRPGPRSRLAPAADHDRTQPAAGRLTVRG
ncbi:MAG: hypothetical protein ACK5YI_21580 [Rhodospirillales bacterium]